MIFVLTIEPDPPCTVMNVFEIVFEGYCNIGLPCSFFSCRMHCFELHQRERQSHYSGCGMWHWAGLWTCRKIIYMLYYHSYLNSLISFESYDLVWKIGFLQLKKMGFHQFVGVDGSEKMLDQAKKTGIYQELKQCMLCQDRLPVQDGNKLLLHKFRLLWCERLLMKISTDWFTVYWMNKHDLYPSGLCAQSIPFESVWTFSLDMLCGKSSNVH